MATLSDVNMILPRAVNTVERADDYSTGRLLTTAPKAISEGGRDDLEAGKIPAEALYNSATQLQGSMLRFAYLHT